MEVIRLPVSISHQYCDDMHLSLESPIRVPNFSLTWTDRHLEVCHRTKDVHIEDMHWERHSNSMYSYEFES